MEKVIASGERRFDYERWTIEELRCLAEQLRVRDASRKTRRELIALFGVERSG